MLAAKKFLKENKKYIPLIHFSATCKLICIICGNILNTNH